METVKLVNRAFAGEEEILCFQNTETFKIYEFSEIQKTYINSEIRDFEEDDWKLVLNNETHLAAIDLIAGGFVTLYVQ
jgi:hypothetical protein